MESFEGIVERVTFFNPENGYSVLKLAPARQRRSLRPEDDLVTVVGQLPEVTPGEQLRLLGQWTAHPDYGKQFKAERCEQVLPSTVEGIRRYLGSGLIRGIGPKTADKIVSAFGADTLNVIDTQPQRLREVPDIGQKRYQLIAEAWETQKAVKEVMVFLQGHGVSAGLAVKIYKHYGDAALSVVKADPYRLARDIWGIGFKTADKIAQALGLPADAPTRLEAGVVYALNELADDGHVYAPRPHLAETAAALLGVSAELVPPALDRLEKDGRIQRELLPAHLEPVVYLTPFYQAEVNAAARLRTLLETRPSRVREFAGADWDWLFSKVVERAETAAPDAAAVALSEAQR